MEQKTIACAECQQQQATKLDYTGQKLRAVCEPCCTTLLAEWGLDLIKQLGIPRRLREQYEIDLLNSLKANTRS